MKKMRLIDADNLILEINKLLESPYANHTEPYTGMQVRKEAIETVRDLCVKQEPTAFDIEKVVTDLEELDRKTFRISPSVAIDIVKDAVIPAAVQEEGADSV